jgi:GAF domain-containing protein
MKYIEKPDLAIFMDQMDTIVSSMPADKECLSACFNAIIEALKPERGFVLLYDKETEGLKAFLGHRVELENLFIAEEVSQSIINVVLEDEKPLVTNDAMEDPRFSTKISVLVSGIRSVLCVPLASSQGFFGLIYIDNRLTKGFYRKEDLDYLVECAHKFSLVVEKCTPDLDYKSAPEEKRPE